MNSPLRFNPTMNPYLFGCFILMAFWFLTLWWVQKTGEARDKREFWWASISCFLLGFTEPLYVPEYWDPPSLLQFYHWDFESFIFCFAIGGIASVVTELGPLKKVILSVDYAIWSVVNRVAYFLWEVLPGTSGDTQIQNITYSPVTITRDQVRVENMILVTFFLAAFGTAEQLHVNVIYEAAFVCLSTALFISWRRPRLRWQILGGGVTFVLIYTVVLVGVAGVYPDFFSYWNNKELSGIHIFHAPLEEYLFAFTFGAFWAPFYEAWKNERDAPQKPAIAGG